VWVWLFFPTYLLIPKLFTFTLFQNKVLSYLGMGRFMGALRRAQEWKANLMAATDRTGTAGSLSSKSNYRCLPKVGQCRTLWSQ
jgi:hypothetical protein